MSQQPKFCRDCAHKQMEAGSLRWLYWQCAYLSTGLNLITGQQDYITCLEARSSEDMCGREARWWKLSSYLRYRQQQEESAPVARKLPKHITIQDI